MKTVSKAIWLGIGLAIGWLWGFLSLRSLLRRSRSRIAPASIAETAADVGGRIGDRFSAAIKTGVEDARRREGEMRASLDHRERPAI